MEYFVTGATLSLMGVFTLTAIAYQKGWLKQAAKQLANEAENRSRQRILQFIEDRQTLRGLIAASNQQGIQVISQITSDLKVLSVRESRELAEAIFRLSVDFQGTSNEVSQLCMEILQASDDEPRIRVVSTETAASPGATTTLKIFEDDREFGYTDKTTRGQWLTAFGRDLNKRVAEGEVCGRDFYALPLELCGLT